MAFVKPILMTAAEAAGAGGPRGLDAANVRD